MRMRTGQVIPPRRSNAVSSVDSSSCGDDAGGEVAVSGWSRRRMAIRKVLMSKAGEPSSSRCTPQGGVKQSLLKKGLALQGAVRKSPRNKCRNLQDRLGVSDQLLRILPYTQCSYYQEDDHGI